MSKERLDKIRHTGDLEVGGNDLAWLLKVAEAVGLVVESCPHNGEQGLDCCASCGHNQAEEFGSDHHGHDCPWNNLKKAWDGDPT